MTSNNLTYTTLYPKVDIYTGLLPDVNELYRIMKESEADADGRFYIRKWEKWSMFGTYAQEKHNESETREFGKRYDEEKYLSDRVYEAYNKAIYDYINRHKITLPENARLASSSFSKYDEQVNIMKNDLTMQYHTDYNLAEKDMPGMKFFITCTTYINDDYDGGDICFYINGESINHKPKAGEILVFPSIEPYYHGVKAITKGNKFFVRNFITYPFAGTKQWIDNQIMHGAYRWAKMEEERLEYDSPRAMLFLVDGEVISYEEVLKRNNK